MSGAENGHPKSALPPPPGVESNFNAPNPLYPWNILTQTICIAIPTILMTARTLVRLKIMRRWALEDWLCVLALLFLIAQSAMSIHEVEQGGGQHMYNLTVSQAQSVIFWLNITQIVYSMSILSTKLALLSMYLGLFSPRRYAVRWWIIIIIVGLNSGFYTGLMFAKIFQCIPRDAIWDKTLPQDHCISLVAILDVSGIWNTVSDVVILILPMTFVFKLHLSRRQKLGVAAIFLVGVIAPVMSLIGVVVRITTSSSPDATYYQPHLTLLAEAECAAGTICTCLPCLQRLYKWVRGEKPSNTGVTPEGSYAVKRSTRKRRTMTHDLPSDARYMAGNYIELGDIGTTKTVTGPITGTQRAESPAAGQGQIWRTTEIRIETGSRDESSGSHDGVFRVEHLSG